MVFTDETHDCDSSKDVWEQLYDIIYRDAFGYLFDFNSKSDSETSKRCKRLYIKIDRQKQPDLTKEYPKFKMAGDSIFNFNEKKVALFSELVDDDNELLKICKDNHHSLLNFSFMPITGGLNSTKGILRCENGIEKKGFDRPDVLIAELKKYYDKKPARIFRKANREALTWYLNLFVERGIAGYCEDIYFIDNENMLLRFLELAKKPICDYGTAIEYMALARDYWEMKKEKLLAYGITDFQNNP